MAVYFFSDVHLGAADKEQEKVKLEKLYSLFEIIQSDAGKVFILGDLFDFWFEYKHAIPKEHLKVVFRLATLIENGIEVHYISGNHDFWLGGFLSREVGIKIHRDAYETTEDGKKIFMTVSVKNIRKMRNHIMDYSKYRLILITNNGFKQFVCIIDAINLKAIKVIMFQNISLRVKKRCR